MANHNHEIAAQLQSVSRAFLTMDNDELIPVLLDTCSALLDEAQKRRPAVADMNRMERSEYTIGYKQISRLVGQYAQELRQMEPAADPAEDPTDSMARLEQLQAELNEQRARNQEIQEQVERSMEDLASLRAFHQSMVEMGNACTPEIIAAQKDENKRLLGEISRRQDELEELTNQKQRDSEVLRDINADILRVEAEIARIPQTHKDLTAAYDAKRAELQRLQQAKELCSEEKQAELEKQILELKPLVQKLEQQMTTLNDQLGNLKTSRMELDRENQTLRAELLDSIDRAMNELALVMEEHQQTLTRIRQQAETFRTTLAECERIRGGLGQWLGSNRRQLDAALAAIDRQEYTTLQQTLNISAQEQVKDAFSRASAALEQVDRLLAQCAEAARKDQAIVKGKAAVR